MDWWHRNDSVNILFLGCYILEPPIYFVWEQIKVFFDKKIKAIGTESCQLLPS
jgi:prolyl-tRNA synthetase